MRLAFAASLLCSGCLLLVATPPPSVEPTCVSDLCSDGYTCDLEEDECASWCSDDTGDADEPPCQDGYACVFGRCQPACEDEDCEGGLVCDDMLNECRFYCETSEDCRGGRSCCTSSKFLDDLCDDIGSCYRR